MSWIKEQWQRVKHLVRPGGFEDDLAAFRSNANQRCSTERERDSRWRTGGGRPAGVLQAPLAWILSNDRCETDRRARLRLARHAGRPWRHRH